MPLNPIDDYMYLSLTFGNTTFVPCSIYIYIYIYIFVFVYSENKHRFYPRTALNGYYNRIEVCLPRVRKCKLETESKFIVRRFRQFIECTFC